MENLKNEIKFYEIELGKKFNGKSESPYETDDGIPIVNGMIDAEYSIAIKADHYPSLQEAENFCKEDIEKFGYAPVLHMNLDTTKLCNLGWKAKFNLESMFQNMIEDMKINQKR